MEWRDTKHWPQLDSHRSSPSTLPRQDNDMTPEFEGFDDPLRRRRYNVMPPLGHKLQSHDSRRDDDWGESSSGDEGGDSRYKHYPYAPYPFQMVMYPVIMPPQPYPHNAHRSRKKQVHYRNTPTIFPSGLINPRHGYHGATSNTTYRELKSAEEYFLNHPVFAISIAAELIDDTLQDEMIPDILEEVITERLRASFSPISEPDKERSPRTNMTLDLLSALMTETVTEEGVGVVRTAIRELIADHMQMSAVENVVEECLQREAPVVAEEVIHEATEEAIVEEEYVGQEVEEVAAQVAAEVLRYYTDKRRVQETKKVEQYAAKKMVDTACLDKLLSIVTGLGVAEMADEYADKPLDDMILSMLLDQYMEVYARQRSTLDNAPLKRWHKNLSADVALDVILDELCLSLDEDLADLDEYELSFDNGTTADVERDLTATR